MATITPILSARSLIPPADADAAAATGSLSSVVPGGELHPVAPKQSDSSDAVSRFVAMYGLHGAASAATPVSTKSTVADVMRGVSERQKQSKEIQEKLKEAADPGGGRKFGNWLSGSDGGVGKLNKGLMGGSAEM